MTLTHAGYYLYFTTSQEISPKIALHPDCYLTHSGFVANSKYKIQALFKDPNCIFQAPKLSTKSHILDADIQKFRLQCDSEVYCSKQSEIKYCFQVLVTCLQVLASKLSTNAKFQNLQHLNSKTFQQFSSTFKHLICFQALSRALKFLFQIQAF